MTTCRCIILQPVKYPIYTQASTGRQTDREEQACRKTETGTAGGLMRLLLPARRDHQPDMLYTADLLPVQMLVAICSSPMLQHIKTPRCDHTQRRVDNALLTTLTRSFFRCFTRLVKYGSVHYTDTRIYARIYAVHGELGCCVRIFRQYTKSVHGCNLGPKSRVPGTF